MNRVSLRVALLMLSCFMAQTATAECPAGKSEVVVVTPSGVSKNICVAQEAIPGIENAANNEVIEIAPVAVCPCADVWTGDYTAGDITTNGAPPTLPLDITAYTCTLFPLNYTEIIAEVALTGGGGNLFAAGAYSDGAQQCVAAGNNGGAQRLVSDGTIFPDEDITNTVLDDPGLKACQKLLADRGCVF